MTASHVVGPVRRPLASPPTTSDDPPSACRVQRLVPSVVPVLNALSACNNSSEAVHALLSHSLPVTKIDSCRAGERAARALRRRKRRQRTHSSARQPPDQLRQRQLWQRQLRRHARRQRARVRGGRFLRAANAHDARVATFAVFGYRGCAWQRARSRATHSVSCW
jgi:hypothetical protein